MKQLTTQQAIERYRARHGDRYDYSKVIYKGAKLPITAVCRAHGEFSVTHCNMLSGQGCPTCGTRREHNWTVCDKHGERHAIRKGCSVCRLNDKRSSEGRKFLDKAKAKHGDLYNYTGTVFHSYRDNLSVVCNSCNEVATMAARNHLLGGGGCRNCKTGGFKASKPGVVYLLEADNVFKFGVTNKTSKFRAKQISTASGLGFHVKAEIKFDDGAKCIQAERALLDFARETFEPASVGKFFGYTECFQSSEPPLTAFLAICQAVS